MQSNDAEQSHDPEEVLSTSDAELLAGRFKLLADPGRVRLLAVLIDAGEMNVGSLAEAVGATESATSHQLRQLRVGGFVAATREGREVHYRVADSHVRLILDLAVEHYLHGHRA